MVESKLDEILRTRQFPGVANVSDGPGSCSKELIFDRPDMQKDIPLTIKKMEESGQLKDPKMRAIATMKLEKAKKMGPSKIDYQKEGHPLDV